MEQNKQTYSLFEAPPVHSCFVNKVIKSITYLIYVNINSI